MNPNPTVHLRFPLADGRTLPVRVRPAELASALPDLCGRLRRTAENLAQSAPDAAFPDHAAAYGNAVAELCAALFGTDAARTLIESWQGNYVGFAGALSDFCARKLRRPFRRFFRRYCRSAVRRGDDGRRL